MLPEFLKPYRIGQLILPKLIAKAQWLRFLPVFRQYAPGGKYDPKQEEKSEADSKDRVRD